MSLRAPFPWFGGKSRAAALVWRRFGPVRNYVEPFFGSGAVLLSRPHPPALETVNDLDGLLANFWRALQADPDAVAYWADYPINETDLHARHRWLTARRAETTAALQADPDFYDAKVAGWWCWGISQWIGSGWCVRPEWTGRGHAARAARGLHSTALYGRVRQQLEVKRPALQKTPSLGSRARGQGLQKPHLPNGGQGVHAKRPRIDNGAPGIHKRGARTGVSPWSITRSGGVHSDRPIYAWFDALADRLRDVRVCCGDWSRVLTPSVTVKVSGDRTLCGVLLDPPYAVEAGRDPQLYSEDAPALSAAVRDWALAHGDDPLLRIALCGYEGEHDMPPEWDCVPWKANGGYGNQRGETRGKTNARRERIWFSPHCLPARTLFSDLEGVA